MNSSIILNAYKQNQDKRAHLKQLSEKAHDLNSALRDELSKFTELYTTIFTGFSKKEHVLTVPNPDYPTSEHKYKLFLNTQGFSVAQEDHYSEFTDHIHRLSPESFVKWLKVIIASQDSIKPFLKGYKLDIFTKFNSAVIPAFDLFSNSRDFAYFEANIPEKIIETYLAAENKTKPIIFNKFSYYTSSSDEIYLEHSKHKESSNSWERQDLHELSNVLEMEQAYDEVVSFLNNVISVQKTQLEALKNTNKNLKGKFTKEFMLKKIKTAVSQ